MNHYPLVEVSDNRYLGAHQLCQGQEPEPRPALTENGFYVIYALRCDWGPQYIADAWINEAKWLGMTITPSYVGEPECNGVIERFMRTLKEQCLYFHRFQSLAEARQIIGEFIARYNTEWLIERLGHRTPVAARAQAMAA
jgi:putative transposase